MNITQPYWNSENFSTKQRSVRPIENTYGFDFTLPWPDLTTAGWYNGQNPVPQRQELVFRDDPEWFAVQNIVPASGGIPRYNIHSPEFKFNRENYTVRY